MNFHLNDEEVMLRDSVARFVCAEYALPKRRELVKAGRDHWRQFADLGWLAVGIPEGAGGLGGSLYGTMLICEVLGGGLALEPYLGCAVLVPQVVLAALEPSAGAAFLASIIEGQTLMALANSEYPARGNLAYIATRAAPDARGIVLNGRKTGVLGGPSATDFLVVARIAGAPDSLDGLSLYRVPRNSPGLGVRNYRMIDSSPMSDLTLDEVVLPSTAIVGTSGSAYQALVAGTDAAIVASAFGMIGAMQQALNLTVEHLRTRKQFGGPLRNFQVLRHRAADMLVQLEHARSAAYRALAALHQPDPAGRAHAVSAAKIVMNRCSRFVAGQAVQLHGGMGVSDESPVSHLFKYIAVTNSLFGDDAYHIERLGSLM